MANVPDPGQLDQLATRLERAALEFEETGRRQVNRSKGLQWTGGAAKKFVDNITGFGNATGTAADALRELATGLRSGANKIRQNQKK